VAQILKGEILFVCLENSGVSQMAQSFAEKQGLKCASVGAFHGSDVNFSAVEAMKEKGIDISTKMPQTLTPDLVNRASLIVTIGCSLKSVCPATMLDGARKKMIGWDLKNPRARSLVRMRETRDEIERRVSELLNYQEG